MKIEKQIEKLINAYIASYKETHMFYPIDLMDANMLEIKEAIKTKDLQHIRDMAIDMVAVIDAYTIIKADTNL